MTTCAVAKIVSCSYSYLPLQTDTTLAVIYCSYIAGKVGRTKNFANLVFWCDLPNYNHLKLSKISYYLWLHAHHLAKNLYKQSSLQILSNLSLIPYIK